MQLSKLCSGIFLSFWPYTGLGKPETLRFEWMGYSRRIDAQNRIVYAVDEVEGLIIIHRLRHHY